MRRLYCLPWHPIRLEELLFGFSFGWYWSGVYEHFTWRTSATLVVTARQP